MIYTSNAHVEFEIKNMISFILAPPKYKIYLGTTLTIYGQGLPEENYEILMNKIKKI